MRWFWAAAVAALTVGLSGCTGAESPVPSGSEVPSSSEVVPSPAAPATSAAESGPTAVAPAPAFNAAWTLADLRPLGQPVTVGTSVVVYTEVNTVPSVTVVDAATGTVRWSRPISVGAQAPGVGMTPTVVAGRVVYLQPDEVSSTWGKIVVAEPDTGTALFTSEWYQVVDRPFDCDAAVCFSAFIDRSLTALRMDPHTGAVGPDPAAAPVNGRTIGAGGLIVIDATDGQPQRIARQVDGALLWDLPVDAVFGPGYSPDFGWAFDFDDELNQFVGSVGYTPEATDSAAWGTTQRMWAIDAASGQVRWSVAGAGPWCMSNLQATVDDDALSSLRCQWSADARLNGDIIAAGSVELQKFDPTTGAAVWSVPMTGQIGSDRFSWDAAIRGGLDGSVVVPAVAGPLAIAPSTGDSRPASDSTLICVGQIESPLWGMGRFTDGAAFNTYYPGSTLDTCGSDGVHRALTAPWPATVGAVVGEVSVVATPIGLQGFSSTAGPPAARSAEPLTEATGPIDAVAAPEPVATTWVASGFTAHGQPVAAGPVGLVYAEIGERLNLVAVDPTTGSTVWTKEVNGGVSSAAAEMTPTVVGGRVVYLTGEPGTHAHVAIADATTGADIIVGTYWFNAASPLILCGGDVCFTGVDGSRSTSYRVDARSGQLAMVWPDDSRSVSQIGHDLYRVTADDGSQTLVGGERDGVVFKVPWTDIVPATYTLYSNGSGVQHWPEAGVYVVELEDEDDPANPRTVIEYGTRSKVVAFDDHTGKVRWTTDGTDTHCLPTAVGEQLAPARSVRCRWGAAAKATYQDGGWTYSGTTRAVEGFDPATGTTTWSVPLADRADSEPAYPGAVIDADTVLLPGPAGPLVVSLVDGSTAVDAPAQFVCATRISGRTGYTSSVTLPDSSTRKLDSWGTGTSFDWCDAAGQPTAALTWPAWIGAQVGDVRMVTTAQGLTGFGQPAG